MKKLKELMGEVMKYPFKNKYKYREDDFKVREHPFYGYEVVHVPSGISARITDLIVLPHAKDSIKMRIEHQAHLYRDVAIKLETEWRHRGNWVGPTRPEDIEEFVDREFMKEVKKDYGGSK